MQTAQAPDPQLERIVALMDDLLPSTARHAKSETCRSPIVMLYGKSSPPALLGELHALLSAMQSSEHAHRPVAAEMSAMSAGRATRFLKHPVIELSTNWAENSMEGQLLCQA